MYHSVVTPTFGDIRATVQQTASVEAWFKLCKLLEKWPEQDRLEAEVIPYVRAHTESWPDRMRVVPDRWVDAWFDESLGPIASLMRRMFLGSKLHHGEQLSRFLTVRANLHLTQLDLGWNHLGMTEFRQIQRATTLENLTHLGLRGNSPKDAGIDILCEASWIKNLRWLDVATCQISESGARALASGELDHIEHLDISRNKLGARGLDALLRAPFITRVHTLMLQGNNLFLPGVAKLAGAKTWLPTLRHLHLGDNNIGDEGAITLAGSEILSELTELELSSNEIRDAGVIALANSPHVQNLTHLNLLGNMFSIKGTAAIANSPMLSKLRTLELPRQSETAAELIVNSPTLHDDIRSRWR